MFGELLLRILYCQSAEWFKMTKLNTMNTLEDIKTQKRRRKKYGTYFLYNLRQLNWKEIFINNHQLDCLSALFLVV